MSLLSVYYQPKRWLSEFFGTSSTYALNEPTAFESEIETLFNNFQNGSNSTLLVALLNHPNVENYDYACCAVPLDRNPWFAIQYWNDSGKPVVIALDLLDGRSFEEQWPYDIFGIVQSPAHFRDNPLITIPDTRKFPEIEIIASDGRKKTSHLRLVK